MMRKTSEYGMMLVFASLSVFLVNLGCDILRTREPEKPGGSSSTFVPPFNPDDVIENMRAAVREKNAENYLRCLAQGDLAAFRFQPTASAQGNNPHVFANWTVTSEEEYFRRLASSKTDGISLLDIQQASSSTLFDSVVFEANYHLVFQHQNTQLPTDEARGRLQFTLIRDPNNSWWRIYRWIDSPDTSAVTWSDFKAIFVR